MPDHILERRVWLPRARAEVFRFFADPASLALISPPALRLRLRAPAAPMRAGSVYDFRISWLGVPLGWRTFIREFDPPFRFVDVQVRGPFARWEHRHVFREAPGGTWVEDRVTYRLPLGPLGRAAHALGVGRQIRATWAYRDRRLDELLAAPRAPADA